MSNNGGHSFAAFVPIDIAQFHLHPAKFSHVGIRSVIAHKLLRHFLDEFGLVEIGD